VQDRPRPEAAPWIRQGRAALALVEEPGLATCATLGSGMCKWPIGDPGAEGFTFCGRPSHDGRPYCQGHVGLAYRRAPGGEAAISRLVARYL
jgi:GcrA cell cycle regulator